MSFSLVLLGNGEQFLTEELAARATFEHSLRLYSRRKNIFIAALTERPRSEQNIP